MRPLRIAIVIGTRPETIKLMPVVVAARARPERFEVTIVRTGQHREVVDQLMDEFGLRADVNLDVMVPNQDLAHVLAESVRGLSAHFARETPDWVLVQGDTTSTLAAALAAFYNRARIGHVEAGLRTGNRASPFPEEANRSLTARLADLHFAPTDSARANLLAEGIAAGDIVLTGNTVVDALQQTRALLQANPPAGAAASPSRYILVTAHRRESHGAPLDQICDAVVSLLDRHEELTAWLPMHPSPDVRKRLIGRLGGHPRARLTPPLGYRDFIAALDGAALVLTDSGGVQEECAALGKPVLVMRSLTERAEAVDAGVAVIVGTDAEQIVSAGSSVLEDAERRARMSRPSDAFGDGRASERILEALLARTP
jgi:UDP-N-acetylglucosamine 2-epimerase (non-hydrolysing)